MDEDIRETNINHMRFKTIATTASILTFINAILFLIIPVLSLSILGRSTNHVGIMITRISGACALGLGFITWSSRKTKSREVQMLVTNGNLTVFGILLIIDFYGVFTSAINKLGWLIFLADLIIFCGFVISFFTFRGSEEPRPHI
ncbi:MAG: hypothetical protein ISR59_06745 [Anaerolineales bacterium]|nr:hypothetical protein [Anaerolineales bacterium]